MMLQNFTTRFNRNGKALIIAAHGSTHEPEVNRRINKIAQQVFIQSEFSEVIAAFHQGEPQFCNALSAVKSNQICVLPMMASEGFYSTHQLPTALAKNPRIEHVKLVYTPPVGAHPSLPSAINTRVKQLAADFSLDASSFILAMIGHGTPRNAGSRLTTETAAAQVRRCVPHMQVLTAFIDDEPPIESIIERARQKSIIVVPFLVGGGGHTVRDIPVRLGLSTLLDTEPQAIGPSELPQSFHRSLNQNTNAQRTGEVSIGIECHTPLAGFVDASLVIVDCPVGHYKQMTDWVIQLASRAVETM